MDYEIIRNDRSTPRRGGEVAILHKIYWRVRISSRDPPFMSPLVRHLCNRRNKQIKMGINPDLQNQINKFIREHQIRAVRQEKISTNKDHGVGGKQSIECQEERQKPTSVQLLTQNRSTLISII